MPRKSDSHHPDRENELDANARPVQGSENGKDWHTVQALLPPIVFNRLKHVDSVVLKDVKLTGGNTGSTDLFCYTVKWHGKAKSLEKLNKSSHSHQQSQYSNYSSLGQSSGGKGEVLCKGAQTYEVLPDSRRCEGPCGRLRSIDELLAFGKCDHLVCKSCITEMSPLFKDPTRPICCNISCLSSFLVDSFPPNSKHQDMYRKAQKKPKQVLKKINPEAHSLYTQLKKSDTSSETNVSCESLTSFSRPSQSVDKMEGICQSQSSDIYSNSLSSGLSSQFSTFGSQKKSHSSVKGVSMCNVSILILDGSNRRFERRYAYNTKLKSCVDHLAQNYCNSSNMKVYLEEGDVFTHGRAYYIDIKKYGNFSLLHLPAQDHSIYLIFDLIDLLEHVENEYAQL
ncbi:unnamed protein product [Bursaphelenchus okinawaensis]|uniref:RING-type domain-containing protein n=1 Tax=Bursaphelenchus okinawaensis TaxID=465554 RepID=A0A811LNR5_9BILA|nr:unnamed protein product [Bursaphelenchus okinawaensis]CAG9126581.1 unnamed protein product [Bursaphelenchus okinawaensis]